MQGLVAEQLRAVEGWTRGATQIVLGSMRTRRLFLLDS
jgi:hypothetical protein